MKVAFISSSRNFSLHVRSTILLCDTVIKHMQGQDPATCVTSYVFATFPLRYAIHR